MRNANDVLHEFDVVATEWIDRRCIESIGVFSFIRIVGLLLCHGDRMRTGLLATQMGTKRKCGVQITYHIWTYLPKIFLC